MPDEAYRMRDKKHSSDVNDVYRDNKIKFKKRNFAIICVIICLLFAGSILATYFGRQIPATQITCGSYFCENYPQIHDGF
jgi:hypothetical protein